MGKNQRHGLVVAELSGTWQALGQVWAKTAMKLSVGFLVEWPACCSPLPKSLELLCGKRQNMFGFWRRHRKRSSCRLIEGGISEEGALVPCGSVDSPVFTRSCHVP